MGRKLEIREFLEKSTNLPVVDVRSPAEYANGHIPGAHSIPLFSNEERAEVGTLYKQKSKDAAFLRGLDIVGPKMSDFVRQAQQIAPGGEILLYCWRGGMRSGSMAWLFSTSGLDAYTLEGGYKAYRHYIRQAFTWGQKLIVLGGMTGSGKTDMLNALQAKGEQVLDLEGIAQHRGSAFGGIGKAGQPPNEHFENMLAGVWLQFNHSKPIWVEDESLRIGRVTVPETLYNAMRKTLVIKLELPFELRVKRLVTDYAIENKKQLGMAIERLKKRLGGLATQNALNALADNRYDEVARILLNYYDKAYTYGLSNRNPETIIPFRMERDEPSFYASRLIELACEHI